MEEWNFDHKGFASRGFDMQWSKEHPHWSRNWGWNHHPMLWKLVNRYVVHSDYHTELEHPGHCNNIEWTRFLNEDDYAKNRNSLIHNQLFFAVKTVYLKEIVSEAQFPLDARVVPNVKLLKSSRKKQISELHSSNLNLQLCPSKRVPLTMVQFSTTFPPQVVISKMQHTPKPKW